MNVFIALKGTQFFNFIGDVSGECCDKADGYRLTLGAYRNTRSAGFHCPKIMGCSSVPETETETTTTPPVTLLKPILELRASRNFSFAH